MIENTWVFPVLEVAHVIGLALFIGCLALEDFAVLGWAPSMRVEPAWSRAGLAVAMATGVGMLLGDLDRYPRNPAFVLKMGLLVVAFAAHATLHRNRTRAAAALSLALWTLVILTGRAVIDFDV